ncbi:MAG: BLUF domain-containing protein [Cyanobacteriota bacterium]|nr:BLUF domain-containing protein [Cyanobacteriota bacterium]
MKRLTYISKFSGNLSRAEVENIGKVSRRNNQKAKITGILLCSGGIFFQILEGEEEVVDPLYEKILKDDRHTDIFCLKNEPDILERQFPEWSMKTFILDEDTDLLIKPIKSLLRTLSTSQLILAKYTQPTILKIIKTGINPLRVAPQLVEKIIWFGDICSFSTLSEKLPPEEVILLLNQFFSICTEIITARGGEVTKFMGDCAMAYFDGDRSDDAIQASLDILTEMEILRKSAPEGHALGVLHAGIGIAKGKVIEGNIGSRIKKDYTIIGDAVNVASRLEALTRKLSRSLLFDSDVKNSAKTSFNFIEMGEFNLKGKELTTAIYSIENALTVLRIDELKHAISTSNYPLDLSRSMPAF